MYHIQTELTFIAASLNYPCLGEIGRKADLSKIPALKPAILNSFAHTTEEVKSAASYALGNIALGNLQV